MNKDIMRQAGFQEHVKDVENGLCPTCREPIDATTFKDDISLREFRISGMCQKCQDGFFD